MATRQIEIDVDRIKGPLNRAYHHPQQDSPNAQFFARDWPARPAAQARMSIANLPAGQYTIKITRVGYRHKDVYTAYLDLGSPAGLPDKPHLVSDDVLAKLRASCAGAPDTQQKVSIRANEPLSLDVPMNENDACLITVEP